MGKDMSLKMAEEFKKYRDILDCKREEFKKQLERSKYLLVLSSESKK